MPNSTPPTAIQNSPIANIQGIFAGDLIRLMIQEGLIGAPIQKYRWGYSYFNASRKYCSSPTDRYADRPVWVPSFLLPDIWSAATIHFQISDSLLCCITRNLFPLLPDLDQLFRYVYRDRPLSASFLDRGILGLPIRVTRDHIFLFDQNAIYQAHPLKAEIDETSLPWHICCQTDINCAAWLKALPSFRPGMTLDACLKIFLSTSAAAADIPRYTDLDRIIQRISRPRFEREPENPTPGTFDRIRVEVNLATYLFKTFSQLAAAVRRLKSPIDRCVLQRLEQDAAFRKYGIPVNFLRVSECVLRRDHVLEYLFELKPMHNSNLSQ